MISQHDKILLVVYEAIDEINRQLPSDKHLEKMPTTELYCESSVLDSLGLVNLILAIEDRLEDSFGVYITISDQSVTSRSNNPFRSVESLAAFIEYQLVRNT